MRLRFTKMQGAGNDFVVLDATREPISLTPSQVRRLGDRRFGVGADQILLVEASDKPGIDFRYRIFNNDGGEVEQCGNGSRCFLRFVREHGLTDKHQVHVETLGGVIELHWQDDGRVMVDMGAPVFDLARVPFDAAALLPREVNGFALWPLDMSNGDRADVAVLSMGNPHAVQRVVDIDRAPVALEGPQLEVHPRFAKRVNAGFMQIVDPARIRLRVFERGAGETLSCGTGACAAVVAGIRLGWLEHKVDVDTRGGRLTIEWNGNDGPVMMTGPAETVFEGEIAL